MLITNAYAQASTAATQPSMLMSYLPLFMVIAIIYFLVIRPQNQRAKAHDQMVAGLNKGDKVVTTGGIHGLISAVKDNTVDLEVAKGMVMTVSRHSIAAVVEAGKLSQKAQNADKK